MYAVIKNGGKQYRLMEGSSLKLERMEANVGDALELTDVLMISCGEEVVLGKPYVANAKVTVEVIAQGRHRKINVIKFRRRKHHRKQMGHRQYFTEVKVIAISQ